MTRFVHTELHQLHSSGNPVLSAATVALPGFTDALAALQRARTAEVGSRPPTLDDLAEQVADALGDGKDLPSDLEENAWRSTTATDRANAANVVMVRAVNHLADRVDQILRAGSAQILAHLDRTVRQSVSDARALGLPDVDAETALAAGAGEKYARMLELRRAYVAAREAQAQVMRLVHRIDQTLDTFGFVRDLGRHWPAWYADARRAPAYRDPKTGDIRPTAPPWPDDHIGRFQWLVHHPEVTPWVPTPEQLRQAHSEAYEAAKPNHKPVAPGEDAFSIAPPRGVVEPEPVPLNAGWEEYP